MGSKAIKIDKMTLVTCSMKKKKKKKDAQGVDEKRSASNRRITVRYLQLTHPVRGEDHAEWDRAIRPFLDKDQVTKGVG